MTPEITSKLQEHRRKSREGTITQEELKEGLAILREGRVQAQTTSTKSRTAKATAKKGVDVDDLLSQFEGL